MKKVAPSTPLGSLSQQPLASSPSTLVVGGTLIPHSSINFNFDPNFVKILFSICRLTSGTDDDLTITIKLDEKKLKAVRSRYVLKIPTF
jgi:hypothetical protein